MEEGVHGVRDFSFAFGTIDFEGLAVDHDLMVLSELYLPSPLLLQS